MTGGQKVARAARACLGARFRPQGRDVALGLDCVGLVAVAFRAAGYEASVPRGYPLRGGNGAAFAAVIEAGGLRPVAPDEAGEGDLLLLLAGPAQFHLAVRTDTGFVHADAGLRRVIETPGQPPWPILGAWRVPQGGE
jgi:hypothetical protein